jgi:hypothetical protein
LISIYGFKLVVIDTKEIFNVALVSAFAGTAVGKPPAPLLVVAPPAAVVGGGAVVARVDALVDPLVEPLPLDEQAAAPIEAATMHANHRYLTCRSPHRCHGSQRRQTNLSLATISTVRVVVSVAWWPARDRAS